MRTLRPPFGSHKNFLDPQTIDGKTPYAPKRLRDLVQERYLISRHINTSYNDVGSITPLERTYLLQFIKEEKEKEKEIREQHAQELQNLRK